MNLLEKIIKVILGLKDNLTDLFFFSEIYCWWNRKEKNIGLQNFELKINLKRFFKNSCNSELSKDIVRSFFTFFLLGK